MKTYLTDTSCVNDLRSGKGCREGKESDYFVDHEILLFCVLEERKGEFGDKWSYIFYGLNPPATRSIRPGSVSRNIFARDKFGQLDSVFYTMLCAR